MERKAKIETAIGMHARPVKPINAELLEEEDALVEAPSPYRDGRKAGGRMLLVGEMVVVTVALPLTDAVVVMLLVVLAEMV